MWLTPTELSLQESVSLELILEALDDGVEAADIDGETVVNAEAFAKWHRDRMCGDDEADDEADNEDEDEDEADDEDESDDEDEFADDDEDED